MGGHGGDKGDMDMEHRGDVGQDMGYGRGRGRDTGCEGDAGGTWGGGRTWDTEDNGHGGDTGHSRGHGMQEEHRTQWGRGRDTEGHRIQGSVPKGPAVLALALPS